ncbi:C1 family peptidase [Myxococcota bacterium]|nr:C1 family peptidase [Myxococcota bacterium]
MKRLIVLLVISMPGAVIFGACCQKKCCPDKSQKSEKKASILKTSENPPESIEKKGTNGAAPKKTPPAPYNTPSGAAPFVYTPEKNGANTAVYIPNKKDPVLKEMTEARKKDHQDRDKATAAITERHKKEKKLRKEQRQRLQADLGSIPYPKSLAEFTTAFHNPPVPQFYTGTCWSFAATSYFESEIHRLTKKTVKLSEMWTVYHNYLEKARRYIRERGNSLVDEGDEPNAPVHLWKTYGVVPAEAYTGLTNGKKRHDHRDLVKEIKAYLAFVKNNSLWDEEWNLRHVALILDKHLGKPPVTFTYGKKNYTARSFHKEVTGLNMDDYVSVVSTTSSPFYTLMALDVPDNWRKSKDYYNVPLDQWFSSLQKAMAGGNTVVIGGDVSEPGRIAELDLFFVPTFDIPSALINQSSREFRIANHTTTDDHGIHLVGVAKNSPTPWFVFKDSGRSSRWGKHKGYYFVSGDYLRLKILTWLGHRSLVKELLTKAQNTK